jgi:hypothetical protein
MCGVRFSRLHEERSSLYWPDDNYVLRRFPQSKHSVPPYHLVFAISIFFSINMDFNQLSCPEHASFLKQRLCNKVGEEPADDCAQPLVEKTAMELCTWQKLYILLEKVRKICRQLYNLSFRTHSNILNVICNDHPIETQTYLCFMKLYKSLRNACTYCTSYNSVVSTCCDCCSSAKGHP